MNLPGEWDDDAADFAAAVSACRAEDTDALRVVLRHGDQLGMLAAGVKIMAELLDDQEVPGCCFRAWAQHAVSRPR